jgi:hypothetical protein
MSTEKEKVYYLPYVYYSQDQAEKLNMNHTEAIIMNYVAYVLPNYWERKTIDWKYYNYIISSKFLSDLPTLDITRQTLSSYYSKLIDKWLLERKIERTWSKSIVLLRATKKYLEKSKKIEPSDFLTLYNSISILLKNWKIGWTEKERLDILFSSYEEKENKTVFNLDWLWGSDIKDYLREEFELCKEWDWIKIKINKVIDSEFIKENIIDKIIENWIDYGWLKYSQAWTLDLNDEVKGKILWNLKKMFQWLKSNKRTVKDFKKTTNTWFWKSYL